MDTGTVLIFGKEYRVVTREARYEKVVRSKRRIYVYHKGSQDPKKILDRYNRFLLYRYACVVLNSLGSRGHLKGTLKIKVINRVTKSPAVLARIRGNFVEISAHLIRLPKQFIKYVIIHEIAHLIVKQHTEKFYTILNTLLPDAKRIEERFQEYLNVLQSFNIDDNVRWGKS